MKRHCLTVVFVLFFSIFANDCYAQVRVFSKVRRHNIHGYGIFSPGKFRPYRQCVDKIPAKKTDEHDSRQIQPWTWEDGESHFPLMIIFALSQGDRGFHERDQRIFFGPDFLTIHELKHKLHEFFDLYETDNRSLEVRIVYMEGDGDTTVQVCLLAHKVQIDLSREQTEEEKKIFVPFEDYPKIYPESAFDENGNISYWRYGSKVDYSVNRRVGSHGTRLEGRKSYIDDGKDKFIDDIVRYTFTWLEQEDKTWSPLSPHGTQTLREIPEPSAK